MGLTADELNLFLNEHFTQVADCMRVEDHGQESVVVRLTPDERHLRPGGTVSGPAMFALADAGFYIAILEQIGTVALAVTTNASIDFMRKPAAGQDLLCHSRILKIGKSLVVGDVLIYSEGQAKPVARANLTYSIPPERGVK
ncbi:MAG: PaaI family thioesterase [Paracoccaceae bacterium]|jgi:uncharacterized protein (TIGR00369 family)